MLPAGEFRFNFVRHIGSGGLGTVDEVVVSDSNCKHTVGTRLARKRLNIKWKAYPEHQERFEREIEAILKMNHSAVISYQGENLKGQERFYAMPVYPRSLRDYLKANAFGVDWRTVAAFGTVLASALEHAHEAGYIHRDLKPENILLDSAGNPIISDWGLGYFVHRDSVLLDLTIGGMGTEYYCSLEQWTTGKCDQRGDIYSLGIVLAEIVRGANRVPVTPGLGLSANPVLGNAPNIIQFNALLRSMTAMWPHDRPATMTIVRSQLAQCAWNPG